MFMMLKKLLAVLVTYIRLSRGTESEDATLKSPEVWSGESVDFDKMELNNLDLHQKEQNDIVDYLMKERLVNTYKVELVMRKTFRPYYVNSTSLDEVSIGHNAVIDSVEWHAFVLQVLQMNVIPTYRVMEIGTGSGYLSSCFGLMLGAQEGLLVSMEIVPELADQARLNIHNDHPEMQPMERVMVINRDGLLGCPNNTQYETIYIGFPVKEVPKILLDQLKNKGRILYPIDKSKDKLIAQVIDKDKKGNLIYHQVNRLNVTVDETEIVASQE